MTDPTRIPIGRSVTYAVRGMPDVPNQYGPGHLVPTEITLTYQSTEDSRLGRVHAYVKGRWRRGGAQEVDERLPGQHYYGDPAKWPDCLAEEARLHDPDATVDAVAHAIDNATPYPIELHSDVCRFMAERLLEMLTIGKQPEHVVWQPEEAPAGQPEPIDPATLEPAPVHQPAAADDEKTVE